MSSDNHDPSIDPSRSQETARPSQTAPEIATQLAAVVVAFLRDHAERSFPSSLGERTFRTDLESAAFLATDHLLRGTLPAALFTYYPGAADGLQALYRSFFAIEDLALKSEFRRTLLHFSNRLAASYRPRFSERPPKGLLPNREQGRTVIDRMSQAINGYIGHVHESTHERRPELPDHDLERHVSTVRGFLLKDLDENILPDEFIDFYGDSQELRSLFDEWVRVSKRRAARKWLQRSIDICIQGDPELRRCLESPLPFAKQRAAAKRLFHARRKRLEPLLQNAPLPGYDPAVLLEETRSLASSLRSLIRQPARIARLNLDPTLYATIMAAARLRDRIEALSLFIDPNRLSHTSAAGPFPSFTDIVTFLRPPGPPSRSVLAYFYLPEFENPPESEAEVIAIKARFSQFLGSPAEDPKPIWAPPGPATLHPTLTMPTSCHVLIEDCDRFSSAAANVASLLEALAATLAEADNESLRPGIPLVLSSLDLLVQHAAVLYCKATLRTYGWLPALLRFRELFPLVVPWFDLDLAIADD